MVAHFMLSGSLRMNILFTTPTLFVQAANYLDIKGLLDVTCKTVANMIKGKTPEEIRKTFNIKNDFTEEEEAQVPARLCSCVQSAGRKNLHGAQAWMWLYELMSCSIFLLFQVRKENQWCEEK